MDSGDWTRIKRLSGAVGNMVYVSSVTSPAPPRYFANTINPSPVIIPGVKRYTEFGLSKIQRPASLYTDYVASQNATYVLQTQPDSCGGNALTAHLICRCASSDVIKHSSICIKCKHDNIDGPTNT